MKKGIGAAVILALVLACVFAFGAQAEGGLIPADYSDLPESAALYMFPDGAPEGMEALGEISSSYLMLRHDNDGGDEQPFTWETVNRVEYSFVSGDERMKDAPWISEGEAYDSANDSAFPICSFRIRQDIALDGPAEVVYRVHMESEHFTRDQDLTVYCVPWEGYGAFTVPGPEKLVYYDNPEEEYVYGTDVAEGTLHFSTDAFEERLEEVFPGIDPGKLQTFIVMIECDDDMWHWQLDRETIGKLAIQRLIVQGMGLDLRKELEIRPFPFRITGPEKALTDGTYKVSLEETDGAGRSFTWQAEGEGVTLLESSDAGATVGIAADAGESLTLTVTADDAIQPYKKTVPITRRIFSGTDFDMERSIDGFTLGLPNGGAWTSGGSVNADYGRIETSFARESYSADIEYQIRGTGGDGFMEDPEKSRAWLENVVLESEAPETYRIIDIGGHPAALLIRPDQVHTEGDYQEKYTIADIFYPRNNLVLCCYGTMYEYAPEITFEDLEMMASHFGYNEAEAPLREADTALTVTAQDGAAAVSAGQKLAFSAAFANPDVISAKNKNNGVAWTVTEVSTGAAPEYAKISDKGVLTVNKDLEQAAELEVTATSVSFGTSAGCRVKAVPALKGLTVDPAELFFYTGVSAPATLAVTADPAAFPLDACSFSAGSALPQSA